MHETFDVMINRLSPTLKRITHRLNGNFTFFSDEDLYQEAVIHMWTDFEGGKLSDKTDSYILQGCFYFLKNYLRVTLDKKRTVSLQALIDDGDSTIEDLLSAGGANAEDEASEAFIIEEAYKNGSSAREREILSMSMDGMTVREIGEKLGISHVMVVKLKNKLKDRYAKFHGELKNKVTN